MPLRDVWHGRPICSYYVHFFVDFDRLRDHINKRACSAFNAAQESRMHLCHKSIFGLLRNHALMAELPQHYAYCHSQIASRSIRKHYVDNMLT